MLSVNNMLNTHRREEEEVEEQDVAVAAARRHRSVLDIANLLCPVDDPPIKSPPLSPSLTHSSASSVASFDGESHHYPRMDYYWSVTEHKKQASCTSAYQDIASQHPHQQEQEQQQQQQQQQQQRRHYTYSAYSFHANDQDTHIKPKRRRANAIQLEVLNRVFERTFFPSTQTRAELGRQLGMSPRTVQIWFQNRRQAIRMRERQRAEKNQ